MLTYVVAATSKDTNDTRTYLKTEDRVEAEKRMVAVRAELGANADRWDVHIVTHAGRIGSSAPSR